MLKSVRWRAIAIAAILIISLAAITAVGLLRTRDHQDALASLHSASSSAASIQHARAEFLHAAAALGALAIYEDYSYLGIYIESMDRARQDLTRARTEALAQGNEADAALLEDYIAKITAFDLRVGELAQTFLSGDEATALEQSRELNAESGAIIRGLDDATDRWLAGALSEKSHIDGSMRTTFWLQASLGIFAITVGGFAATWLLLSVVRPLARLRQSAREIALGRLGIVAPVSGPREVAGLAEDFNEMTARLLERTQDLEKSEQRYRLLFERNLAGVYRTSVDGRILQCNSALARLMGYRSPEELTANPVASYYVDEKDRDLFVKEIKTKGVVSNFEACLRRRDGTAIWVLESATLLNDERDGDVIEGTIIDITERKRLEADLRARAEARLTLAELSQRAVAVTDLSLFLTEAVEITARHLGVEYTKVLELLPQGNRLLLKAGYGWRRGLVGKATVDTGTDSQAGFTLQSQEAVIVEDLGSESRFTGPPLLREHGVVSGVSVIIGGRDEPFGVLGAHTTSRRAFSEDDVYFMQMVADLIATAVERKRAEETIEHMAYHDPLTGLPNRRLLTDRLAQSLARARRAGSEVAVIFLDLDQFKVVNDTLGHGNGDRILQKIADRLATLVREADTLARVGGDEFTILLADVQGAEEAVAVAERILEDLRRPATVEDHEFLLTASIGIATFPADGDDPEALLGHADTAMYQAKAEGRNSFRLYSPAMHARIAERLAVETGLRHAIQREELILHYQPQVSLATGKIIGVEALLRWRQPDGRLVYPGDFIEIAEDTGLILPIGEFVLLAACRQMYRWLEDGLDVERMAVNLSARQLQLKDLAERIAMVLEKSGLPGRHLQLEITEGTAMRDLDLSVRTLRQLRQMGIEVALDDFGTGHSSLSYLRQLPIDIIKIDKSFIQDVTEDRESAALVRAIIAIAHSLGLRVVAEGVETREQLDFLGRPVVDIAWDEDSCDEFQGFVFSKPVGAEEIARLLASQPGLSRRASKGSLSRSSGGAMAGESGRLDS